MDLFTRLRIERGSIPCKFSLLQNVQAGSGANPAS
jgi:hypothetical protein